LLLLRKSSISASKLSGDDVGVTSYVNKPSVKFGSCFTSLNIGADDVDGDDVIITSLLSLLCVEFITCFKILLTSRLPGLFDDVIIGVVGNDLKSTLMRGDCDVIIGLCLINFVFLCLS